MMPNHVTYAAEFTAQTALVHGSPDNLSKNTGVLGFRREVVLDESGKKLRLPVVSGNSIRHQWRQTAALYLLHVLDLGWDDLENEKAAALLFHGGLIEKGSREKAYSPAAARRTAELLPIFSVFGGNLPGGHTWEGLLEVGMLYPMIEENEERFGWSAPARLNAKSIVKAQSFVRMDSARTLPHIVVPLGNGDELTLVPKEKADSAKAERKKSDMMPYKVKCAVPGSRWWHRVAVRPLASELERSFIGHTVELWLQRPSIGGMSRIGFGDLKCERDYGQPSGELYEELLRDGKDSIREELLRLIGEL